MGEMKMKGSMMEQRRGGARKSGGFGKKEGGFGRREGGFGASRGPRREGTGAKRPYVRREEGSSSGYERKPRAEGERSYRPRAEGSRPEGERSYRPRAEGERSFKPRGEGRSGGYERKPRAYGERSERGPRRDFGDKPAYRPRREAGERSYGERSERAPRRDFGDKPAYRPRREEGEGGYRERAERSFERPQRDFERPQRGEGKNARFDGKRETKRDYKAPRGAERQFQEDGWLVGYHAVLAALKAGRRKVRQVWLLGDAQGELAQVLAANPDWPVEIKAKPDFEREFGDAVHQGVAALVGNLPQPSLPELLSRKPKLLVALDQVTDPHNLGAIVRSCAAFGAEGVLVTENRSAGLSATAAKAAAGAMETVPVAEVVNLVQAIEMLKEAGFRVIGLAGEATVDLATLDEKGPLCLIVGSEGDGLRRLTRENCDVLAKIAISDAVESLNVSVATGVALAMLKR